MTDPALLELEADAEQLERVFLNVLRNAIDSIGQDRSITVRLLTDSLAPRAIIEDSGRGIAPEVPARFFTPFFTTKPDSSGVGLTLVSGAKEVVLAIQRNAAQGLRLDSPGAGAPAIAVRESGLC